MSTEASTKESTNASHLVASLRRDHKPADEENGDHGVSIITMAGHNSGATLKSSAPPGEADMGAPDLEWATLVNSNSQDVNNSILLGSKYKSHDPGVHVDISESLDEPEAHKHHPKRDGLKGEKKKKKKKKGSKSSSSESDSDPHSHSSGSADL